MADFDRPCPVELADYFSKPAVAAAEPDGWSDDPFHVDDDLRFDLGGYHPLTPSSIPEAPRSLLPPTLPPLPPTTPGVIDQLRKHVGFEKASPLGYPATLRSATPDQHQGSFVPPNPLFPTVPEPAKGSMIEEGLDRVTALLKVEI